MDLKIFPVVEEQVAVRFTGKVNILSELNRQYMGHILFKDGEIFQVIFQGMKGLKAFYQLLIKEFSLENFDYVVEPEIVEENERQIHYPYGVLKNKLGEVLKLSREALKFRPPDDVKIISDGAFLKSDHPVSVEEFAVMATLSEWNSVFDIYRHCPLLEYEITMSLVSLRKKGALKILSNQNP